MSSGSLRKYRVLDFEGFLLSIPLILFEYYILGIAFPYQIVVSLIALLFVLGLFFNYYTGFVALVILCYLVYAFNFKAFLYSSAWLIGLASSGRTSFIGKLLSYMLLLLFNAALVPSNEHIYIFISSIPVLLYLSRILEKKNSATYLSLSLLSASSIVVLSKITGSILSLNMFASIIVVSIHLAYKTINTTTEA